MSLKGAVSEKKSITSRKISAGVVTCTSDAVCKQVWAAESVALVSFCEDLCRAAHRLVSGEGLLEHLFVLVALGLECAAFADFHRGSVNL